MLQVVVLVRDVPDDAANAMIAEDPGTTAVAFYPVRDAVRDLGFHAGELLFVSDDRADDGTVKFHKTINLKESVVNSLIFPH